MNLLEAEHKILNKITSTAILYDAELLYYLSDFPEIESWYISRYGKKKFAVLKITDTKINDTSKNNLQIGDILICDVHYLSDKRIFQIDINNVVIGLGDLISISKNLDIHMSKT